jgi:Secretion system C-terminal sorting domain
MFSIATAAVCALSMSYASTYFVNASTGNDTTNNGTASGSAFKTITHALSVTGNADVISVAAGTYNKTLGETFPLNMVSGVTLSGTAGPLTTIIDATGDSSRVFVCTGNSATTIIEGFTITGGFSINYSSGGQVGKGGGIYITNNSQTVIQNNIITRNTARGYDFFMAGAGALNGGSCYGGGIYIDAGAPTIRNNVISYNVATAGGGQDFRGGWSGNGSSGGDADGGGIYAVFGGATTIINNTFYGNQAIGGRGGASNSLNAGDGGNAKSGALDAGSNAIVKNNIFSNNSAVGGTHGGGAGGSNGTATDGALTSYTAGNLSYNLYYKNSALSDSDGATLGTNNILGIDPLFVSATNFHFSSTSSPAYHAGTPAGAPTTDLDGTTRSVTTPSIGAYEGTVPLSVDAGNIITPRGFELAQNYPNPFNPSTTIGYSLASSELVSVRVYDVLGREVMALVNERQEAGTYSVRLDASTLSSGIYYYRLNAGSSVSSKKMLLLK